MMETNKIYLGDCLEVMKTFPDEHFNLIVTSPPYNKNGFRGGLKDTGRSSGKYKRWDGAKINYDCFDDNMDEKNYKKWQIEILNEFHRILKDDGSVFYNHKIRRFNNEASHPIEWILESKLKFYQQIVWQRNGSPDQNINYCTPTTELIFWLAKDKPKVFKKNTNINTEIWSFNFDNDNNHPAPFPETFPSNCILLTTEKNDLILDPFLGSGTSIVSALKLERNSIGIELSKSYCDIANKRIQDFLKQTVLDL